MLLESSQFGGKGLLGPENNNKKIKLNELHFIKIKKKLLLIKIHHSESEQASHRLEKYSQNIEYRTCI